MKIRIKGNTLRYRLTKSDIAGLKDVGYLQEHTNFAGQPLTYAVQTINSNALSAQYQQHTITLFVPKQMVAELTDTERVGFEAKSGDLHLLIEKDFTCLDEVDEDQSDNYPNPLAAQKN